MSKLHVILFSGSLRRESYTTKLVRAFIQATPEGITSELIDISQLPLINEDLETNLPQPVRILKEQVQQADAAIFATPEYNRSYSPVLKNALDWASRPDGKNSWDGKPAAVIGCTPYNLGAFGAQHHLRQVLTYLNMPTMQQPEFYLERVAEKMSDTGEITDASTQEHITSFWAAFAVWIERVREKEPLET